MAGVSVKIPGTAGIVEEGHAIGSGCAISLECRHGSARKESALAERGRFGQAIANR
jgi:hypothetical protein